MNRFGCTITSSLGILRWHLCVDTLPAADLVVDPVRESLDTGVGVEAEASAIAVVVNPDSAAETGARLAGGDDVVEVLGEVLAVTGSGVASELEAKELLVVPQIDDGLGLGLSSNSGLWLSDGAGSGHGGGNSGNEDGGELHFD